MNNKESKKLSNLWIAVIPILTIVIIFAIITALNSVTTVPTGFVGVKTRFGQVQETVIQEGLNVKVPYVETIVKMDCRTKLITSTSQASTKDLQTAKAVIAVNYNVNKETANNVYKEIGIDYEQVIINPAILGSMKSITAQYTAEELLTKREEVSDRIRQTLVEKISKKGFDVTDFNMTDIDFSDEFDKAIEAKAVKQQEVAAAQAELEKQKIQNEKEISVAQKDAQVMELQNSQITENTLRLKELEVKQNLINKWNGTLPTTSLGQDVMSMFNLNN